MRSLKKSFVLKQKLSALLGAVIFALGTLSPVLKSTNSYAYSGSGSGTSGSPYVITSCNEFKQIDMAPSAYYLLANNIDCASEHNSMIAAIPFSGHFDGNSHSISIGLQEYPGSLGLFSVIDGGTVHNLELTGTVDSGAGEVYGSTGSLAGSIVNASNISQVTSSVDVGGRSTPMGGLSGTISASTVTNVSVTGNVNSSLGTVGGLFGVGYCSSLVMHSSMSGDVTGNGNAAGGIVGEDSCEGTAGTYSDVHSTGQVVSDGDFVGGIVGMGITTTMNQSYSTGYIEGINSVGGIAGHLQYGSSVYQSYATGQIVGYGDRIGGVVGNLQSSSTITQSYSTSSITTHANYAGGLLGFLDGGSVDNSYARGSVHGNNDGGLVGWAWSGSIGHSYSTGSVETDNESHGGFAAQTTIMGDNGLFWDTDSSGIMTSAFGYGKTTSEMKDIATYTDTATPNLGLSIWDFAGTVNNDESTEDIWALYPSVNDGYPCLAWQQSCNNNPPGPDLNGDGTPDSEQPNVGGYTSSASGKIIAIDVGAGCELTTDDTVAEGSLEAQDPDYNYESELWEWEADCSSSSTTVKLYYYDVDGGGLLARKYNPVTKTYANVPGANISQQTIDGHTVTVVTYGIEDNGELDFNPDEGTIQDPVGLATPVSNSSAAGSGELAGTGQSSSVYILIAPILIFISLIFLVKSRRYLSNETHQ